MNTVYYGNHAYGIEAAAQTYFSRRASKLSLLQSALLAGLPQAPSIYDPFKNPERAIERRNDVLKALYAKGDISYGNYREAIQVTDLHLRPGRIYTRIREPYFFGYVRDELIKRYGATQVRQGGLKVYTTIDPRMQQAATKAIKDTLYYDTDPASALVAIDPRTGAIKTMTAVTPGRSGNQFNLAAQARRQAGSTFKTFVLTQAVSQGINPDTTSYVSAPLHYQPNPNVPAWDVSTYSHTYVGSTSITHATLLSDNTVYARLTLDLGAEKVAAMANRMGIRSSLKTREGAYVPSLGLGSIGVSPLDMASAYATLAAGGIYSDPMAITKVVFAGGGEDRNWGRPKRHRVIADWVAAEVTKILEENIQAGTGVGANIGRPAGGKTGTTENHADAWFDGITPTLTAAVWVGYPQAEIPMENVHGIAVAGGTFPATIWKLFMDEAIGPTPVHDFPPALSEPIWHSWTPGSYGGPPPPSSYSRAPGRAAASVRPATPGRAAAADSRDSAARACADSAAASGRAATGRAATAASAAIAADAGTRLAARVTALAAPLFLLACAVPDGGLFRAERYRDVHIYGLYADGFLRGDLPYRDVFVEYPPGAFAVFMPPAVLPGGAYNAAFKTLMALCGIGALFAVLLALVTLGASRRRLYAAAVLFALAPVAVGPISLNTYDLFPAALTAGALAAILRRRELLRVRPARARRDGEALPAGRRPARCHLRLAGRGSQTHAARARRVRGRCRARRAPVRDPRAGRALGQLRLAVRARLQIESLGASVLLAGHRLGVYTATVVHGATGAATKDLAGQLPDALATITTLLQAAAVGAAWWLFARGARDPERLVIASTAAVTGFLVFNRFISPQYVVWLIPLVLLLPGATRIAAVVLVTRRSCSPRSGSSTTATSSSSRASRGSSSCATRCCSRSTCCSSCA